MRDAAQGRLAVGFFDGVHLGHQAILKGADAALTFSVHPLSVLTPDRAPCLIMSLEERIAAIRSCGVREVRVLDFTRELADTAPEAFLRTLAGADVGGRPTVRCGDNWRFGKGGAGDADFLRAHGFGVEVVPYADYRGARISSSRIRLCLAEGRVGEANAMLGRPYAVRGEVVRGKGLGGTIGFPTLNIRPSRPLNLRTGVYAVRVAGVPGVANYGLAPTMGDCAWTEPVLEVHLLEGPVPEGGCGAVEFARFLRAERKFASLEELKRQISEDCENARGDTGKEAEDE